MGKALLVTTAAVVGIAGIVALNYFDPAKVRNATNSATDAPAASQTATGTTPDAKTTSALTTPAQPGKTVSAENIENAAPVLSDASGRVAISDDGDTLASATVQITGSTAQNEALSVNLEGTDLKSAFDSATKTLTISGVAPLQDYETALQRVAFDAPKSENDERTLQVIVNDGELASDPAFLKASVQTVGDEEGEDSAEEGEKPEEKATDGAESKTDAKPEVKQEEKKGEETKKSDDEKDTLNTGAKESDVQ
ncbi:MAG: hypothetical protein ABW189_02560 [Rickettsiales bacterium]